MTVEPCTVREAKRLVKLWHRHLEDVQGGLFAAKVTDGDETVAVALAGNPARVWQGTGRLVISRVATPSEGAPRNACSMLYGALSRAARHLGYREVWTYTLPEEDGASVKAANFEDMGLGKGGNHGRVSRPRAPAIRPERKRRWRLVLKP
ncbi:MAG TPA: XF1762 family protein [Mycobacterium sp.]|nr:XF1762 family protein [Mycobacterium sp.]